MAFLIFLFVTVAMIRHYICCIRKEPNFVCYCNVISAKGQAAKTEYQKGPDGSMVEKVVHKARRYEVTDGVNVYKAHGIEEKLQMGRNFPRRRGYSVFFSRRYEG